MDFGLPSLHVFVGVPFMGHGAPKLFGLFGSTPRYGPRP